YAVFPYTTLFRSEPMSQSRIDRRRLLDTDRWCSYPREILAKRFVELVQLQPRKLRRYQGDPMPLPRSQARRAGKQSGNHIPNIQPAAYGVRFFFRLNDMERHTPHFLDQPAIKLVIIGVGSEPLIELREIRRRLELR